MKQKIRSYILICMLIIVDSLSYSQQLKHYNQNLDAFIFKIDSSRIDVNKNNVLDVLFEQLNLNSNDYEFLIDNTRSHSLAKDKLGLTHESFIQFYKGIKIEGSDIRIHYRGDKVVSVNGEYAKNIILDLQPELNEEEAINLSINFINAKEYRWEIPEENIWMQEFTEDTTATFYPKTELVICKNRLNSYDSAFHLAYKINISAIDPFSQSEVYIDSKTGIVLYNKPTIFDAVGTAYTRYGTNTNPKNIETTWYTSYYYLKDITRGNGIETKNMQHMSESNYLNAIEFTDNNNNWTIEEFHNANKDDAALDAHWGMMMTYDYFLNVHERNSYDNQGAILRNYVHINYNFKNAYWNPDLQRFFYGDGDGSNVDPFTCLDIIAHEFGHAFCSNTARLEPEGESGSLGEGLSDIWAACVEYYTDPTKSTWLCGEEIMLNGSPANRSMENPNSLGQPDCYGYPCEYYIEQQSCYPDQNNDNCWIHRNSGIMNHWFYILVNGKSGTNDLGDYYNVTGIGIDKAAELIYLTETQYWTPGCYFSYAKDLFIYETKEFHGEFSPEAVAVTNAWYAVGVGEEFECDDWEYICCEDYTTDIEIDACNLEIYDITITNSAKLTLNIVNTVILSGPFEVSLSSELEIN